MGYYTGNGMVSDGGESARPLTGISFPDAGSPSTLHHYEVQQKTRSTTTVKPGVSLTTAQAATSDISLAVKWLQYNYYTTGGTLVTREWPIENCKGTTTDVAYAQINGSNLYELRTLLRELSIRVKYDNGNWSSWESS